MRTINGFPLRMVLPEAIVNRLVRGIVHKKADNDVNKLKEVHTHDRAENARS